MQCFHDLLECIEVVSAAAVKLSVTLPSLTAMHPFFTKTYNYSLLS